MAFGCIRLPFRAPSNHLRRLLCKLPEIGAYLSPIASASEVRFNALLLLPMR